MIWSLPCLSWLFLRVLALFLVYHPLSSASLLSWLMVQDCVLISVSWHCVYMPGVWQQLVIACLQGLWSSVGAVDRGRCSNDSLLCDIHKPAAVWSVVLPVHPQGQKSFCPDSLPSCFPQLLCWVALPSFPRQDSPVIITAAVSASLLLLSAGVWNQLFSVAETIGVLIIIYGLSG